QLVEALQPARDLSHSPLFQVMFVMQNAPSTALRLPGLALERVPLDTGTAKFDLMLTVVDAGETLLGLVEFALALFDAATALRLGGHLATLLEAALADPERPARERALR